MNEFLDILDNVSSLCNGDYEQYNMIKTNCNSSIVELNKQMMDFICTYQELKTKVLQMLQDST